jgi:hypothetical protein
MPNNRAMFDSKLAAQQASGAVPTPTLYFEAHVPHERATYAYVDLWPFPLIGVRFLEQSEFIPPGGSNF